MNKKIEEGISNLIKNSTAEKPLWNMERIIQGKPIAWNYTDGVMISSVLELYKMNQKKDYLDFCLNFIDYFVQEDGTIKTYSLANKELDSIRESKTLFDLYKFTNKKKYLEAIEFTYKALMNQPRTKAGSFYHKLIYKNQVWLDGFYMAMPFYISYLNMKGIDDCSDIINQYKIAKRHLCDKPTGLYHHGYDASKKIFWCDKKTGTSKSFWLRSIGWFICSLVDSYELLKKEEDKKYIGKLLKDLSKNLLKYIDEETSLFYQVVDQKEKAGNYIETSGSLMIAYAFLKGSRLGVLQKKYQSIGKRMFKSVTKNYVTIKNKMINLSNICLVSGLGPENNLRRDGSYEYYISEPVVLNDGKGLAAYVMTYVEMRRLEDA